MYHHCLLLLFSPIINLSVIARVHNYIYLYSKYIVLYYVLLIIATHMQKIYVVFVYACIHICIRISLKWCAVLHIATYQIQIFEGCKFRGFHGQLIICEIFILKILLAKLLLPLIGEQDTLEQQRLTLSMDDMASFFGNLENGHHLPPNSTFHEGFNTTEIMYKISKSIWFPTDFCDF